MADSIREKILQNIETTLTAVTSLSSVQRWKMHGNTFLNVPCVIINAGPEPKQPSPNPLMACQLTVFLDLWIRQAETDTTPTDTVLNNIFSDIETALMADVTRGGFAVDSLVKNSVPGATIEGEPSALLEIELEIHYRHQQSDPTTSG